MMCIGFMLVMVIMMVVVLVFVKDVIVQMKISGKDGMMVFELLFVKVQVGDVIYFVLINFSYNVEMIVMMLFDGVVLSLGQMNKEFVLFVIKFGIYGIKCKLYYVMGMVVVVQVGNGLFVNFVVVRVVKVFGFVGKCMVVVLVQVK